MAAALSLAGKAARISAISTCPIFKAACEKEFMEIRINPAPKKVVISFFIVLSIA
jgi:hypothetical protein